MEVDLVCKSERICSPKPLALLSNDNIACVGNNKNNLVRPIRERRNSSCSPMSVVIDSNSSPVLSILHASNSTSPKNHLRHNSTSSMSSEEPTDLSASSGIGRSRDSSESSCILSSSLSTSSRSSDIKMEDAAALLLAADRIRSSASHKADSVKSEMEETPLDLSCHSKKQKDHEPFLRAENFRNSAIAYGHRHDLLAQRGYMISRQEYERDSSSPHDSDDSDGQPMDLGINPKAYKKSLMKRYRK